MNGTPIELHGRSKPFSHARETSLDVHITNVELSKYLAYVPADLRFQLHSGSLHAQLALSFTQPKEQRPALLVHGKIGLTQLALTDRDGHPIVALPLVAVPIESLNVFSRKVHLGTILLHNPAVHLQRDKAGVLNVTTLMGALKQAEGEKQRPQSEKNPGDAQTEAAPTVVEIAAIRLTDGTLTFMDETQEKPFQTTLHNLNVVVRHVSTDATKPIALEVSCTSDAGEMVHHTSTIVREPLQAAGTVSLHQMLINRYAPYYAKHLLFNIEDGKLDVSTQFTYTQGPEHNPSTSLSGLAVTLNALRLRKRGEKEDFLKVPTLAVKDTAIDVEKHTITVGALITHKGTVQVRRERDGTLSVATLVPSAPAAPEKKPGPTLRKGKRIAKEQKPPVAHAAAGSAAPPWIVKVKTVQLNQYALRFDDKVPAPPVTVRADPLSVTVENFSTEKNNTTKATVRVTLNKTGTIVLDGPMSLSPFAATFNVNTKNLDMLPFRPYFADKLKIALTSGAASAQGNLVLQPGGVDKVKITYTGQAAVTKVTTVDKTSSEDFLKWKSLSVTGVHASTSPWQVDIKEVTLADFYARLMIHPDTTFNVQGVVAEPPPTHTTTAQQTVSAPAPSPLPSPSVPSAALVTPIKIANVTLQRGTVDFSDHVVTPNYSAKLTQLGGRVSALLSTSDTPAEVDLRANLRGAPLTITGKVNPFSQDLFVDLSVDSKDIDLHPMTPYAGKYAGYTIAKGTLTFNLKYLIANRQLQAENKIFIDQFTFGDAVESPHATKLPVKLAIALLKDRHGAITLDVPLGGSMDDPQFSVWGTLVQVMTNLIAKAATAPFALIGAAFGSGSGEEMNHVEFAYGRVTLDEVSQEKLKKIGEALAERPSLSLEIAGYVDKDKDLDGLKQYRFERQLKAQKLNDAGKKDRDNASLDEVKIDQDEYLTYLTMAYRKADVPKPRHMSGLGQDVSQKEMEALLLTPMAVSDADLRALANQRAEIVREFLLEAGHIESGRIFLVEPKAIFAEHKATVQGSRVELAIK